MAVSVTRLGDLLDFRQLFKAFGDNCYTLRHIATTTLRHIAIPTLRHILYLHYVTYYTYITSYCYTYITSHTIPTLRHIFHQTSHCYTYITSHFYTIRHITIPTLRHTVIHYFKMLYISSNCSVHYYVKLIKWVFSV